MIERFDVAQDNSNPVYELFRRDHIKRYEIARDAIDTHFAETIPIIVDAACGCGYGYEYLCKSGIYIGVDIDLPTINQLNAKYPDINLYRHEFVVRDLDDYKPSEHRPDVVISLETAEHILNPREFFYRVRKSLSKDGLFIFSAPTSLTMDFDPYHKRDWDAAHWHQLLKECGFTVTEIIGMPFTAKFTDFLHMVPTTVWQKWQVAKFDLLHPTYAWDRLKNWILMNQFFWQSTMMICQLNPVYDCNFKQEEMQDAVQQ